MDELKSKIENLEKINMGSKLEKCDSDIQRILQVLDEKPIPITNKHESYSDVLKSTKIKVSSKPNLPVVIIKPKRKQTYKQTKTEVQNQINPISIKATVKDVKEIKDGGIVIKMSSTEEVENIRKLSEEKLSQNYSIKISKMRNPRLVIIGTRKEYTEEQLLEELRILRYIDTTDNLKIIFVRQSKHSKKFIIHVETNGITFHKLVNKNISLGWDTCQIKECFNIMVCYKCSGYGHKTKDCESPQVCSYCSEQHTLWNCKKEKPTCVNCKAHNSKFNQKICFNHEALTDDCPIHQKRVKEAKERTNYL